MPYAPSRVVPDRSGRLAPAPAWFAFYVHDALVAERCGDLPQLAFLPALRAPGREAVQRLGQLFERYVSGTG